jgi:hypothetical protein
MTPERLARTKKLIDELLAALAGTLGLSPSFKHSGDVGSTLGRASVTGRRAAPPAGHTRASA